MTYVYPGHPITIAWHIVKTFATMEDALAPSSAAFAALSDSRVPGAGGNVYLGMDVLRKLRAGEEFSSVMTWADEVWCDHIRGQSPTFDDRMVPGQVEADALKPQLAERSSWWALPDSGALLDIDGTYRYRLWRRIREGSSTVLFAMLNPSTADASVDDPTIRKCRGFAQRWGFDRFEVVNVFAYRATDPAALRELLRGTVTSAAVGPRNLDFVYEAAKQADLIVCAWGAHPWAQEQAQHTLTALKSGARHGRTRDIVAIKTTKDGHPSHPLYLKYDLSPVSMWER